MVEQARAGCIASVQSKCRTPVYIFSLTAMLKRNMHVLQQYRA